MIKGPLLVGEQYLIRREIVGLGESRQTEGYWTRSRIFDKTGTEQVAEMLLYQAFLSSLIRIILSWQSQYHNK